MNLTPMRDKQRDMGCDMSHDACAPEPLSSRDCDLRGLEWMPLQTADLLDSDLFLFSTGDEFKAAMALICKSWRQVPAGSLPNDDTALAQLSLARDWTSVRTMALRNWVLCSDGRLYHPVVAKKAMEALPMRQEFVAEKTAASERKQRERDARRDLFAVLREQGIVPAFDTKTKELRALAAPFVSGSAAAPSAADGQPVTPRHVTSHTTSREMSRLGQDTTVHDIKKEYPPKPPRKRRGGDADVVTQEQLVAEGVQVQHAKDWLKVRKDKRLPLTPTAWAEVKGQAQEAGLPLDEAIRTAVVNSWGGFKAKWLQQPSQSHGGTSAQTPRQQRVAEALPGIAARSGPPPRTIEGEVTDVTPRTPALAS